MKKNAEKVSLIIDVTGAMMKGPGKWDEDAIYKKLKDIGIGGEIRKLAPSLTSAKPGVKGNKKTEAVDKFLVETPVDYGDGSPWDVAFTARRAGVHSAFIEPDMLSTFWVESDKNVDAKNVGKSAKLACSTKPQWDNDWKAPEEYSYWYLDDQHSQLRSARTEASTFNTGPIRIAHLDTGYDKDHHESEPAHMRFDLQG